MNTRLDISKLQDKLASSEVGHTIDYHERVASTMPIAHTLARDPNVRAGTVVVAEEQISGRGRMQRRWEAPFGQALLASFVLKPPLLNTLTPPLPMLTAVVVARSIQAYHPALTGAIWLKWPNDVLLGNSPVGAGKVAGILIEAVYEGDRMAHAVIGIGINANQSQEQLPPVYAGAPEPASLRVFLQSGVDRTELLIILCQALAANLDISDTSDRVFQEWRSLMTTLNRQVIVHTHQPEEPTIAGRAVDVTREGELVVVDNNGKQHIFSAADVSIRPTR